MKFIHTADLHLGYKFNSSFPHETFMKLLENQKRVLSNIIALANEKNVDGILIAGDLFDTKSPEPELFSFVKEEFKRTKANIFIACGNHDPLTFDSVYKKEEFPPNVYIFPEEITSFSFDGYDVYGYSFVNSHKTDNSLLNFRIEKEDKINLMVAHGDLNSESFYGPVRTCDIEKSGLTYLALGHIHIDDGIKKAGDTLYGYSGAPQGSTFKETISGKVIYLEINENRVVAEEIPVFEHIFSSLDIDISSALTNDDVVLIIKSHLASYDLSKALFNITLTGTVDKSFKPDKEYIKGKLSSLLFTELKENLRIKYNIDLLKEEKSIRGEFVRNAFKMLEGKDPDYIRKVIEYGVEKL